ncbi:MAG: sugar-binding transcriptional regulator [Chloroflexi bacterium]|nr:sugar-binding transcriptional regulator [Chloroflexota bacterium]
MIIDISSDRHSLLSEIAELYYIEGLSQEEIAAKVNLSRPSISRLLNKARELGVVKIQIDHPIPTDSISETKLVQKMGIRSAHVLDKGVATGQNSLYAFGRLGANVLSNTIEDGMVFGVTWGTTVHAIVSGMSPTRLPNVKIVQLLGGVGAPYHSIDGPEQVRQMGELLSAQHYYLNAPIMVDTPEVANVLRNDHSIKEVLDLAKNSDVALIGIGSIVPEISTHYHSGYLTYDNLRELDKQGIVGSLCSYYYDINGVHQSVPWVDDCMISITWKEIIDIPTVIGVGYGAGKGPAILGALRTKVIDILITDRHAAEEVLRLSKES